MYKSCISERKEEYYFLPGCDVTYLCTLEGVTFSEAIFEIQFSVSSFRKWSSFPFSKFYTLCAAANVFWRHKFLRCTVTIRFECKFVLHVQVTVHRDNLRINNQQDASSSQNLILSLNSTCFGHLLCPSSGVVSCTRGNWYVSCCNFVIS